MAEAAATELLQACGLPQAWGQQNAWRILDAWFDRGLQFLTTWQAWRNDPCKPRLLHYVALSSAPPQIDDLLACATAFPELGDVAEELAPQWFGLAAGFHRVTLDGGRVLLTLCVGDLTAMLRQQQFLADSIYLDPHRADGEVASPWNVWTVKALARCCRRGTTLASPAAAADLRAELTQCGFELQAGPAGALLSGQFNPRWTIKNTRDAAPARPVEVGTCAVIGAGLAGASVAAALARRGWQVRVLDQANEPAAGASGLPVGLVVPHVSADDCALSRLSRSGVRLMLHQARSLLRQGQDWDATGTLQRQVDGPANLPDIWHKEAAWLKPARLVDAWLAQPGITFQGGARVSTLRRSGDQWELLDGLGHVLARADRVVLANANGAMPLLETLQATLPAQGVRVDQLPAMHGVRGQLSWALHQDEPDAAFPLFPVNGAGSVIPAVPVDGDSHARLAWFVGSSYQPDSKPESPDEKNHAANFGRLQRLIPALAQVLAKPFAAGAIHAWKNTRCVTADRLPVVGPLYRADDPTLWICAGMGSRGLSFSVLCAELLAARWGAEPLAVDAGLVQSLFALRGTPSMADNI